MNTAILFVVFNRPDTTARVFEAIRSARPTRLYVAADGPRQIDGEPARCNEARRIATAVDWPCDVRTLFREKNLGCGLAVSSAIDWFFEHEEEGIILEDDCLPSQSFFRFCSELLERYRSTDCVKCVSGTNFISAEYVPSHSYLVSRYPLIWGWATWRRAWQQYDRRMEAWTAWRASGEFSRFADDQAFRDFWSRLFDRALNGEIDTWDYQWTFSCWLHGGLTLQPARNLISNIGFGAGATHTLELESALSRVPAEELAFPLMHPEQILRDEAADAITRRIVFEPPPPPVKWWVRLRMWLGVRTRLRQAFERISTRLPAN